MDTVKSLQKALRKDHYDLAGWLALADALEEQGEVVDANFYRLLVAFAQDVQDVARQADSEGYQTFVGIMERDGDFRVYIEVRRDELRGLIRTKKLYAWVELPTGHSDGSEMFAPVYRGSWKSPAGPILFNLLDGPKVWKNHLGPFGLNYLC
jgi:hypothetical protein